MSNYVTIFEVGPRDGLQNQKSRVETEKKIQLVNLLSQCGLSKIEVTSFVSPKWVPQLSDAGQVLDGITRDPGTTYAALVPNMQGMDAALSHKVDEVAVFTAASDAFNQNNTNTTIGGSLKRFAPIIDVATRNGVKVRGYVSTIVDCPYSGPVDPNRVLEVSQELLALGCYQISLGDTLGNATPKQVDLVLSLLLQHVPADVLAGHFHDTSGRALDNISICLDFGLRTFDASVGGLGGCPYAPGAQGNVATEAVVSQLHKLGYQTGVSQQKLQAARVLAKQLKS